MRYGLLFCLVKSNISKNRCSNPELSIDEAFVLS